MPLFGAHMSVAGGLWRAVEHIEAVRGDALQVFTANQRRWEAPRPPEEDAERFRAAVAAWGGGFVASHASYLFNLASPDEDAAHRSVQGLATEIERCALLGIAWVVLHPGAHLEGGRGESAVADGTRRVADRLARAFDAAGRLHPEAAGVGVLLENTAGQGTCLGADVAELGRIVDACPARERLGVCIDTAHACAAGYDLATQDGYARLMAAVDGAVGLARVRLFHVNDSATPCGARSDRHAHVGLGHVGAAGFARLVRDPRFSGHPMVLETHKGKDLAEDRRNLRVLRRLAAGDAPELAARDVEGLQE